MFYFYFVFVLLLFYFITFYLFFPFLLTFVEQANSAGSFADHSCSSTVLSSPPLHHCNNPFQLHFTISNWQPCLYQSSFTTISFKPITKTPQTKPHGITTLPSQKPNPNLHLNQPTSPLTQNLHRPQPSFKLSSSITSTKSNHQLPSPSPLPHLTSASTSPHQNPISP